MDKLLWKHLALSIGLLLTSALFYLAWVFPTFPGDERALLHFQSLQNGWLNAAALAVSTLGLFPISVVLMLAVAALLWLRRKAVDASIVLLSMVPMALGNAIKMLVDRPRPDYLLLGPMPNNMSFPSGHSIYALLFGGILILLAEELIETTLIRRSVQAGLVLLILAVGASRVYLGVHWPSDIIGGYLFGLVALVALLRLRNRLANRQR